ncbi:MAG: hypothetical protein FWE78_02235 [Methanimicrococcus sp.]|nr:hypothetical protein [Methanimicrococcus sp.]
MIFNFYQKLIFIIRAIIVIMTVGIVITNKEGIAMAADSVQTITTENGHEKTYPYANKLFAVSYGHSIGIMVYGNANYYGIPWETLIKLHRKKIANKTYNYVEEYAKDFLNFIETTPVSIEDQKIYTYKSFLGFHFLIKRELDLITYGGEQQGGEMPQKNTTEEIFKHLAKLLTSYKENVENSNVDDSKYIKSILGEKNVIQDMNNIYGDYYNSFKEPIDAITDIYFKKIMHQRSGFVIAGYGEKEMWPIVTEIILSECRNNKLMYIFKKDENTNGRVFTYAQSEMVHTFLYGLSGELLRETQNIISTHCSSKAEKETILNQINEIVDSNLDQTFEVIKILQKPQLASMAETLVNITSFKETISFDMETVGGPADVAVISKTDGFIWIKRKQYFDAALNPHFNSQSL